MIAVTMFSKEDCQLCDQALQYLDDLQGDIQHELEIIDIDDVVTEPVEVIEEPKVKPKKKGRVKKALSKLVGSED